MYYVLDIGLPMNPSRKPIEYEIDSNGCWICVSHIPNRRDGYPRVYLDNKKVLLSHLVFYHFHGGFDDLYICHKCDNPGCINPDHLYAGTLADNAWDMAIKERSGGVKLAAKDIYFIRKSHLSHKKLAEKFNVSLTTISKIQLGKSWKHLPYIRTEHKHRGSNHHRSKLNKNQVLFIRQLSLKNGLKQRKIAEIFHVTPSTVNDILQGRTWSWVKENSNT